MKVKLRVTQIFEFNSYEDALIFKNAMDTQTTIENSNEVLKEAYDIPIELKEMKTEVIESPTLTVYKKVMGYTEV